VHVISTVPEELNRVWQFNRRLFAGLLMRAAREALQTLLSDPKYLGATPGIISALHGWGRNLNVHPNVHCLVTAGVLHHDGTLVIQKRSTLLPARELMPVFCGKLRALFKQTLDAGELQVPSGLTTARLHWLLNRLGRIDWNVRIQERDRHGVSVAGDLARYVTGGPISDRRIESVQNSQVIFRYRDHRDGKEKRMRKHARQ
jgi:hypothetical protein